MASERSFAILFLSVGIISLCFLGLGFFLPQWIVFDMHMSGTSESTDLDLRQDVKIGLWTVSACVDMGTGEICGTVSMGKLQEMMGQQSDTSVSGASSNAFFGSFLPVQILMVLGSLSGCLALALTFVASCQQDKQRPYTFAALSWGVAGILVFVAVGLQAQQNANMARGIQVMNSIVEETDEIDSFGMHLHFPWSLLLAGVGAGFSVLNGLVVSVYLCRGRREDHPSGHVVYQPQAQKDIY